ncbi:hypothetical protein POM88_039939 [Heracleum sosnowskyi]|uniref:Leucine-rich repeat-containing N-terminal plant-type domain-containing protein n=1 Tax=Heracleum sosnowskyi TaxID=360622 RepID=A0AAD8HDS6_9APIA|nr:hypothetical protein POM88_039939 [Heracleum sosnowskyi]
MNTIHPLNVLLVLLVLLCMKTSSFGSKDGKQMTMRCIEREREALLLFRQSVANEYDHLHSWKKEADEDCCKWKGVGCDNHTGHVTHLLLSSLISPRPSDLIYSAGGRWYGPAYSKEIRVSISSSLLDLPHLKYLDLSSNQLYQIPDFIASLKELVHLDFSYTWAGGPILSQIGNLSNLQYLNLSYCGFFSGRIPKFIGSLNSLRYLDLSVNSFTGVIPHELGNLSKLQHLALAYNYNLKGGENFNLLFNLSSLTYLDLSFIEIDPPTFWPSFIQRIPSLSVLRLSDCNLSAPSSTLSNFSSSIATLDLGYNHINSSIFEWLSHLSGSLVDLDLSMNGLEGRIPESLGYMTALTHLYLYGNHLTGMICNLSSLQVADFSHNNFTGNLDDLLSHLSSSLVELDLSYNNLTGLEGRIPKSFGHMTALTFLSLENNLLNGPIPPSFGHMTALAHLDLGRNLLTGPIPDSFALMTALSHLDLSSNQLNGVIPKSFGNSSSLQVADFSSNNFTGNLEDFLSGPFPLLKELYMSENQLTGSMPDITLHSNLLELEVNSNQLNGYLPTVFEHHSALRMLDLSNNHLRGSLPDFTGFSSLISLNLNNNEFFGRIPDLTGCSSLENLQLGENRLTEWETQSIGLLYNLWTLDLAKNSIHSTITEAHLSNLSSLQLLKTSFNSITFEFSPKWIPPFQLSELSLASCKLGPTFPKWIRNQRDIYHLDISDSQISDTIPVWFWNLSGISFLNLSSNNIRGRFSSRLINLG